jgi:hypothetical protein
MAIPRSAQSCDAWAKGSLRLCSSFVAFGFELAARARRLATPSWQAPITPTHSCMRPEAVSQTDAILVYDPRVVLVPTASCAHLAANTVDVPDRDADSTDREPADEPRMTRVPYAASIFRAAGSSEAVTVTGGWGKGGKRCAPMAHHFILGCIGLASEETRTCDLSTACFTQT